MKQIIFILLIVVANNLYGVSPYISKVYEYSPAPGQFINELPEYETDDTGNDMRLKAEECIAEDERILISLGGYGGYVIFGFDHLVENIAGEYDFKILANAFYANANPNPYAPKKGGSCEPGIVMVSYDANGNYKPDDEWYELAGSEYGKPETIKDYQITYYRPDPNKIPTPDNNYPYLNDTTYIKWTTNGHGDGYLSRNVYHLQSYFPLWTDEDHLTFEGDKLNDNYVDESGNGTYYVQYAYEYGYVDNHPNNDTGSNFDISWAVDKSGGVVNLPGIHFVKVMTGVNQYCGWLGETSTEVMGAQDLHLLPWVGGTEKISDVKRNQFVKIMENPVKDMLTIVSNKNIDAEIYSIHGKLLLNIKLYQGMNKVYLNNIDAGIYILKCDTNNIKFIKK
ncbi:MAG: T9SS type A sorting domain-containing protein [Dysgonamonadaceae bacterium]|jgi:hypothetical protein|nr:T9SS type A sorting domain-containing protein [Dysgonamonadaceae bacterium]